MREKLEMEILHVCICEMKLPLLHNSEPLEINFTAPYNLYP